MTNHTGQEIYTIMDIWITSLIYWNPRVRDTSFITYHQSVMPYA